MGKHFGFSGSTIVAGGGKTLCGLILGLIVCTEDVGAATYYISPTGSDAAAGTATGTAWKTWAKALGVATSCGDTLLIMDGTFTDVTHGNASLTKVCTLGNEFTIRAINQRVPLISSSGAVVGGRALAFEVINSAYIIMDGLRIKSADNPAGNNDSQPMRITASNHIIFKNGLLYENNRYFNDQILSVSASTQVLVEDTEIYKFHRHAYTAGSASTFVTFRRVYCHSRNWADIPGGYDSSSISGSHGDSCVAVYPADDITMENVIAENTSGITEINASGGSHGRRNKLLGSIALGSVAFPSLRAAVITARGMTTTFQPTDNTVRDVVAINSEGYGIASNGAKNTQVFNSTMIGGAFGGFVAQTPSTITGGGANSFFCTNCLAVNNAGIGLYVVTGSGMTSWGLNYPNSFGNGTAISPAASDSHITNELTVNPQMGTCYLWLPDASPLKGAGLGGADIGATILYRYKNGVLTNVPLWNPTTGEFPHGALVAGVNDVAGQSLFDVHKRLNVNTNGCSFPANYGNGVTDVDSPNTPGGLRIF